MSLLRVGATGWMRVTAAAAIFVVLFAMSVTPLWLGTLADPGAAAAKVDFDPLVVLEPLTGSPFAQLVARTSRAVLATPSVRPVFGPAKTPWPEGFWTPDRLFAASIISWALGLGAFPFFVRAASGLPLELATATGWARLVRALVAALAVRVLAGVPSAVAFRVLPSTLGGTDFAATSGFLRLQGAVDGLSVVVLLILFLWPYACALHDLDLVDGAVWTAVAWRRQWPWVLAILGVAVGLRFLPPLFIAGAKAAGAIHWGARLGVRTVAAGMRFWLDAATVGVLAVLVRSLGPGASRDPRLPGGDRVIAADGQALLRPRG